MTTVISKEARKQENDRLRAEIEKRHGKSVDELRAEREKRVRDASELRQPDRVPVTVGTGVFAARAAGLTASAAYYDRPAYREACKKMLLELEPDTGQAPAGNSGNVLDILDTKNYRWPGGPLPPDAPYQFVEGEYMKPEEYDMFLNDPSDFIIRYYFPRIYGALAPLSKLPALGAVREAGFVGFVGLFARPEFQQLAMLVQKAAAEQQIVLKEAAEFAEEMEQLGFPRQPQAGAGVGGAPFDAVSDLFRGMRGVMMDMYRRPEKLLAACDRVLTIRIANAMPADPNWKGIPQRGGGPLHRGSDGFMSKKQFETFYWPGLKKSTLASIELGYIVSHFFEGVWDKHLEYLLEFPKGKIIFHCEKTDVFRAKEIIGNHMCIQGGVPPTLLEVGTPQEVEEHCKKLIKVVGKGGGFILGPGSAIDCAKPANVKAMADSVKKYRPD